MSWFSLNSIHYSDNEIVLFPPLALFKEKKRMKKGFRVLGFGADWTLTLLFRTKQCKALRKTFNGNDTSKRGSDAVLPLILI